MSLIHEALKKAEAQRRLGEPPTLGTPLAGSRKRSPLLPVLGALIAVALGAGWWLSSRQNVDDTPKAAAGGAPAKPLAAAANATATGKAKTEAPISTAAERRPTSNPDAPPARVAGAPVNQAPTPAQPPTVKEVAERESEPHPAGTNPLAPGEAAPVALGAAAAETLPNDPAGVAAKAAAKQQQAAPVAAATPPAPLSAKSKAAASPTLNASTKPDAPPSIVKAPTAAPPPAAPPPAQPAAVPAPAAPAAAAPVAGVLPAPPAENLPLYWQLPLNIRKDLPALKLSMHVYSATPDQRFIILNGNRQKEGDDLGADVRLTEIRADGAVLEFHGQRFLVPRGGS
ncbi:MAG TPA: general secretion pathway protein GspB [Tahibacter sp.]|nr:general secretion pathway protein GspB [Tahibacter sp.]